MPSAVKASRNVNLQAHGDVGLITLEEILNTWIPYRLQALETLRWARGLLESEGASHTEVLVDGRRKLNGNVAAIANPMIEAGFIHARALLEFLGLRATKDGRLAVIERRKDGDVAVENFSTCEVILSRVRLDSVAAAYEGPREEAEDSLVAIFQASNRLLAHVTDGRFSKEWTQGHVDTALRGIPVLIANHLYLPLGRNLPQATSSFIA